jgi:FMN-dependent NADH-azoreductase
MNKGVNYIENIIKFMGIKKFEELLVDGTGFTEQEKKEAIDKAEGKIDDIIHSMKY